MPNRKSRKSSRRPPVARPATSAAALPAEPEEAATQPEPAAVSGPAAATPRRRIERLAIPASSGSSRLSRRNEFAALDSADAAIPFDRVPYVPADLRRVAVMAALMVVLIIVAAVVVSHTIG